MFKREVLIGRKLEEEMNITADKRNSKLIWQIVSVAVVALMTSGMPVMPLAAAEKRANESRVIRYRAVDRVAVENLQRWVAAGHEDWCKDPRLVAANELTRITPDFGGDAVKVSTNDLKEVPDEKRMTFSWAPLDGRAIYRITVERFDWLLPIAKDTNAIVWVPTIVEIQSLETTATGQDKESFSKAKTLTWMMQLSRS